MRQASIGRRGFLKSAAVTGAAIVGGTATSEGQAVPASGQAPARSSPASAPAVTRELDPASPVDVLTTDRPGGDFMVDVMKTLDFEFVAANPGSSFRGLHESLVNHGGNRAPEFITCCHEESAVAMAHGYFKVAGKPMAVLAHGTVERAPKALDAEVTVVHLMVRKLERLGVPGRDIPSLSRDFR